MKRMSESRPGDLTASRLDAYKSLVAFLTEINKRELDRFSTQRFYHVTAFVRASLCDRESLFVVAFSYVQAIAK